MSCNWIFGKPPWSSVILTWPLAKGLKLACYTSKFLCTNLDIVIFLGANVCVPNNSLVELMQYYEQTVTNMFVPLFYGFIHDSE